ncbi:hypothetical protein [Duganella phyllosphaerae]|uniref:Uncharacterized protein n=1 Tax=Duganella phyllosphaerae TaxID=762836 RepID=A0A1E7W8H6_9BURK|nr:hypothetical protein [Duganella phyllosphaerae]OEZ92559.1 hypothetical protein DUPY_48180 [Duganella phyllosphaerae]
MKRTLIGFGLAGMLLFALAWLLSFAQPQLVAAGLNQAIALQVERQIGQHAAALPHPEQAQRAESATKAAARGAYDAWRRMAPPAVQDKLAAKVDTVRANVTAKLLREWRIFTACNALAFAVLALTAALRGRNALQLLLPAVTLTLAVAITAGLYLFNQNWLHTVVFNQYTSWAYSGYLLATALWMADILLNRARVTTQLVSGTLDTVGAVISP